MKNTTIIRLSIFFTSLSAYAADETAKTVFINRVEYHQQTSIEQLMPGIDRKVISLHTLNPIPGEPPRIAEMRCTTFAIDDNPYGDLDYIKLDGRFVDKGISYYLCNKARDFCWKKGAHKMLLKDQTWNNYGLGVRVQKAHAAYNDPRIQGNDKAMLWDKYQERLAEDEAAAKELYSTYHDTLQPWYENSEYLGCSLPTLAQQDRMQRKQELLLKEEMEEKENTRKLQQSLLKLEAHGAKVLARYERNRKNVVTSTMLALGTAAGIALYKNINTVSSALKTVAKLRLPIS